MLVCPEEQHKLTFLREGINYFYLFFIEGNEGCRMLDFVLPSHCHFYLFSSKPYTEQIPN